VIEHADPALLLTLRVVETPIRDLAAASSLRSVLETAVRVINERRFKPPREVLVEHNGWLWPQLRCAWRLCDDGRGR
jgi:hypothetical protein